MLEIIIFFKKGIIMAITVFITFIKYFIIILCGFYIYTKLLSLKPDNKAKLSFFLFELLILPIIYFMKIHAAPLSMIVIVLLFAFFISYTMKTPINLSLTVSAISFSFSYTAFFIAAGVISLIDYQSKSPAIDSYVNLLFMLCNGLLSFLLSMIPFRIRRLQKGMPFLYDYGTSDIGVYISVSLLISVSFFGISKKTDLIMVIPVFFCFICGLTLFFWWKNSLTKKYLEKVKLKEIEELQKIIHDSSLEIERLKLHNNELSKIIHKDNKLIPAMEYAVKESILAIGQGTNQELQNNRAAELLKQLEDLSKERTGILTHYETNRKMLSSTEVPSVDSLLTYMLQKANQYQIGFDLSLNASVRYYIDHLISEEDIKTLLADIIENAIIASKTSVKKNILLNVGIYHECYVMDIYDSGENFTPETLLYLGRKRTTTHIKDGGSGIGLMTTFDILKKYHASFVLEELQDHGLYSKKVSVYFDNLGQYRIKTTRKELKESLSIRGDILFESDEIKAQESTPDFSVHAII